MAYAILVEEYQRLGVDLTTALERMMELGEATPQQASRARPAAVAASNEASMALLKGMLKDVEGAPKPRPRKRK